MFTCNSGLFNDNFPSNELYTIATHSASLICPCASLSPKVEESYPSRVFLPKLKQDLSGLSVFLFRQLRSKSCFKMSVFERFN